ncbi:phosphotransferase enzyme family protein [Ensifer adhaerens]|uniref:phosphotransferase enzyme family protein n=1 Tax=Ensifer adhaerens TaxID=106592 RepID=UPI00098F810F|nr:phosphotransferase [Ensifer adhaerens]
MTDIDKDWLSSRYARSFTGVDLVTGGVNRTYRVREGNAVFYLRLYRPFGRPLAQIEAEVALLAGFPQSAHVGVSRPLATADEAYVIDMPSGGESRHACLFESADGDEITFDPAHMERFGAAIAHLHLAMPVRLEGAVRSLDPVAIVRNAMEALGGAPASREVKGQEVMSLIEHAYLPALLRLDLGALPLGLCHGDPWTGNARVANGRTVFFDFDEFGHGPLVLDLSTAAWHFAQHRNPENKAMMDALVRGYDKVRPLSVAERDALPIFIALDEVRSLLFLARYCTLSDETWAQAFEGATTAFSQVLRAGSK